MIIKSLALRIIQAILNLEFARDIIVSALGPEYGLKLNDAIKRAETMFRTVSGKKGAEKKAYVAKVMKDYLAELPNRPEWLKIINTDWLIDKTTEIFFRILEKKGYIN